VTNAGVSGDTSAAGLQRLGFVLDSLAAPPDLAIVELGGNDLLRGIAPSQTRQNLTAILSELQARRIPVLLMGMRAPPNLGEAYVAEFDSIYPELARQFGTALVPFLLEPVYDKPELIQPDRIHPTAEGIEAMVAATVDDVADALPE
jgi:acyl-CoA thioesterase-1